MDSEFINENNLYICIMYGKAWTTNEWLIFYVSDNDIIFLKVVKYIWNL